MGHEYSVSHAADLAVELPKQSRTNKALGISNGISLTDEILCSIDYWCHVIAWQNTKDGQKNRNKPKPILECFSSSNKKQKDLEIKPTNREELDLLFGRGVHGD